MSITQKKFDWFLEKKTRLIYLLKLLMFDNIDIRFEFFCTSSNVVLYRFSKYYKKSNYDFSQI